MMGRQLEQAVLLHLFRLEGRILGSHLLCRVDAILDLSFVREYIAETLAHQRSFVEARGRPQSNRAHAPSTTIFMGEV